ncbi:hypothetical protein OC842_001065 [Tilletia horrida]|uniref:Uncharacterized protein n=1 Tax=Tilletia horrida TaxID=155126 RepID=A0AAN6GKQ2_9BASI|nr:hypothetical protein OC842_001065 [Tilletia horrida]
MGSHQPATATKHRAPLTDRDRSRPKHGPIPFTTATEGAPDSHPWTEGSTSDAIEEYMCLRDFARNEGRMAMGYDVYEVTRKLMHDLLHAYVPTLDDKRPFTLFVDQMCRGIVQLSMDKASLKATVERLEHKLAEATRKTITEGGSAPKEATSHAVTDEHRQGSPASTGAAGQSDQLVAQASSPRASIYHARNRQSINPVAVLRLKSQVGMLEARNANQRAYIEELEQRLREWEAHAPK